VPPPNRPRDPIEEPAGPWADAECKWFSRPKGYGFVVVDGDTAEVFVHMDILRRCNVRELRAGQRVRVRVARTDRGLMATALAVAPAPKPRPTTPAREKTAGERKTGVIGALLSIDEAHGFGLVDLPDLDAIGIADITLLRAAGLLDPRARNGRLICDIEFAPPLIHIRCLTRLH
jgi:cold shock CspA family protein